MRISYQIKIEVGNAILFEYLMDVNNRSAYIPALEEVILMDPLPLKTGSRYIEVANIAGRKFKTTYQLVDLITNERIQAKTIKSVFPITATLGLKPEGDGSVLSIILELKLSGIFKLGSSVIRKIVSQQTKDILRAIKRNVE